MYKIYCDGVAIHDPSLDSPERLVYGATLTQQANMADSFSFTIYPNNPGLASISTLVSTIEVYQDDELLFRGRPIQSTAGWDNQQTITCEGGLALFNDTIVRPYSYTGSVQNYLQQLVTQHNQQVSADKQFTLRTVTVTDPNNNIVRSNENYVVTLQEMADKLVNNLGGYMVVTYNNGWILDYLATNPGATSQKITLAKNLLDYLREQNAQNIATALIPLGATDDDTGERITIKSVNSGKDYIVDQTAAAQYGLIFATETWDDVTVPANLLTKAQARLTDYTRMIPTIQLTAVDMSLADQSIEPIRLLDTVTVEDDQHTASGQYVVMQRTYNLSDPSADKVTFGGAAPTMSGAGAKAASEIKGIPARVLQTASDRARAILDAATDGAIQTLYNNDGVAYEMRINNSQDPDTATKWWRYNVGGWGFTPDGGQTYKIAATMDGALVASLITTGILQSDDNGQTFYLDLDNGVLKGNFSELKISGNAGATQAYADQAEADAISTAARNTSFAISEYDDQLGQNAVFNKLTNNGQTQGIFLQDGKIYINGDYIQVNDLFTRNITASNFNITGGSVRINTANQTYDYITLNHEKSKTYMASNMFLVENKATADHPYLRGMLQGGGLFFLDTSADKSLASLTITSGYGVFRLYNTGDSEEGRLTSGSLRFIDGAGVQRTLYNKNGAIFYDSSGNEIGKCSPYFKILNGVGNSGQVDANSYKDYSITFSSSFAKVPNVFPALNTEWTNDMPAHMNIVAHSITKTGFTVRVYNGNSSNQWVPFKWIAISY